MSVRVGALAFFLGTACAQTVVTSDAAAPFDAAVDVSTGDAAADRPSDTPPPEPRAAVFAVGTDHACRIRSARQVQCWGGSRGAVPGGDPGALTGRAELSFDRDVLAVTAGTGTSCALLADRSVRCWGSNYGGLLGNGSTDPVTSVVTPTRVVDLDDAVELDGSGTLVCARRAQGGVACWGDAAGNTGNGDGTPFPFPRPVLIDGTGDALQICVGLHHGCFIGRNHRVSCWGDGRQGQTGQDDLSWVPAAREVSGLSGIVAIACGLLQTCALDDRRQVWCWGSNAALELGVEGVPFRARPAAVPGLPAAAGLPSMGPTPCAVTSVGSVWCWGRNQFGQLGPTAQVGSNRATPAEVSGLLDAVDVTSGLKFTCARRRDRAVLCWGSGEFLSPELTNQPVPTPTVVFPAD